MELLGRCKERTTVGMEDSHVAVCSSPQKQGHQLDAAQPAVELPETTTARKTQKPGPDITARRYLLQSGDLGTRGSSPPSAKTSSLTFSTPQPQLSSSWKTLQSWTGLV